MAFEAISGRKGVLNNDIESAKGVYRKGTHVEILDRRDANVLGSYQVLIGPDRDWSSDDWFPEIYIPQSYVDLTDWEGLPQIQNLELRRVSEAH